MTILFGGLPNLTNDEWEQSIIRLGPRGYGVDLQTGEPRRKELGDINIYALGGADVYDTPCDDNLEDFPWLNAFPVTHSFEDFLTKMLTIRSFTSSGIDKSTRKKYYLNIDYAPDPRIPEKRLMTSRNVSLQGKAPSFEYGHPWCARYQWFNPSLHDKPQEKFGWWVRPAFKIWRAEQVVLCSAAPAYARYTSPPDTYEFQYY